MPIYDYEDPETRVKITLRRPIEERNKDIVLKRLKTVPDRLAVIGKTTPDEDFAKGVMKGYHRQEELHGSRMPMGGFTAKQIKEAWSSPD